MSNLTENNGEFVGISEVASTLQQALIVKFGKSVFTPEEVEEARELLMEPSNSQESHILQAMQKLPEICCMYVELRIEAVNYVRHSLPASSQWPRYMDAFHAWNKAKDEAMKLAYKRERAEQEQNADTEEKTAKAKVVEAPEDAVVYKPFRLPLRTLSATEKTNLQITVALMVLGIKRAGVKPSQLKAAKGAIRGNAEIKAWYTTLCIIPGIAEMDADLLSALLFDMVQDETLLEDEEKREKVVTKILLEKEALLLGVEETASNEGEKEEVTNEEPEQTTSEERQSDSDSDDSHAAEEVSLNDDANAEEEPENTSPAPEVTENDGEQLVDGDNTGEDDELATFLVNGSGVIDPDSEKDEEQDSQPEPEPSQDETKPDQSETKPEETAPETAESAPEVKHVEQQEKEPENTTSAPEPVEDTEEEQEQNDEPIIFEPGRHLDIPSDDYHRSNGISSSMIKDGRVSLMFFKAKHVDKKIKRENSKVLDMGKLFHTLTIEPEQLHVEYSIEPIIPANAFTKTDSYKKYIEEFNASLPEPFSVERIKQLIQDYNSMLPEPFPVAKGATETLAAYQALPEVFQRVEDGARVTAKAMDACIREFNATLEKPLSTAGNREALLDTLATVQPSLVEKIRATPEPLKTTGTKADLAKAIRSVNPDAVFADELIAKWKENPDNKVLVTREQLKMAYAMQEAVYNHPTAGKLINHNNRTVEASYFSVDEETGLEVKVRPDVEVQLDSLRIGFDLKSISMFNVKAGDLRAYLHREIIRRDYHLSAAMYCEVAFLDQFFWIFVNKDENYHWVVVVEASPELLELGALEYHITLNAIANAFDTGNWPAPIVEDYMDELSTYDQKRLEFLKSL